MSVGGRHEKLSFFLLPFFFSSLKRANWLSLVTMRLGFFFLFLSLSSDTSQCTIWRRCSHRPRSLAIFFSFFFFLEILSGGHDCGGARSVPCCRGQWMVPGWNSWSHFAQTGNEQERKKRETLISNFCSEERERVIKIILFLGRAGEKNIFFFLPWTVWKLPAIQGGSGNTTFGGRQREEEEEREPQQLHRRYLRHRRMVDRLRRASLASLADAQLFPHGFLYWRKGQHTLPMNYTANACLARYLKKKKESVLVYLAQRLNFKRSQPEPRPGLGQPFFAFCPPFRKRKEKLLANAQILFQV